MTLPQKENPLLIDKGVQEVQNLLSELTMFTNVFGRAFKRSIKDGNIELRYPALYTGGSDYMSLLPDDSLGNYCFVEIDDPQTFIPMSPVNTGLRVKASLVAWYDMSSLYTDNSMLYTEEVKQLILLQLNKKGVMEFTSVEVTNVYEEPENVFRYNLSQIDSQYLLYPYHGIRIEFNMVIREVCVTN